MQSPDSYEQSISVWDIVCQYSAVSEHHELRQLIGEDLIDQTLELRRELELLLELLADADDGQQPPLPPPAARLPEPPQMRERLTQEIVFFLESIRERTRRSGGIGSDDLKRLAVSQEVVDYAYESSSSRPSTGMSRLSLGEVRVTPCSSRPGSRSARSVTAAGSAAAEVDVAQMRDQLTYMRCDEVRKRLRQYLQEEIEALKEDLASMQEAVASGRSSPSIVSARATYREATLAELRTERHKLEQALLSSAASAAPLIQQQPSQQHLQFNKPANASIARQPSEQFARRPSSAQRLRSLVQQSRLQPELPAVVNSD
uniref:Uncharacterized protein n=1 Tax=Macrostomum lignano TaxID=282301 RepID=A0A1I8IG63_9PLAT